MSILCALLFSASSQRPPTEEAEAWRQFVGESDVTRSVSRQRHVVSVEPDARVRPVSRYDSLAESRQALLVEETAKPKEEKETGEGAGHDMHAGHATKWPSTQRHGPHNHGGHGHAEHDHDAHLKETPKREGVAVSATLFAVWSLVMTFYFLGNSNDPDIKAHTWQVLAVTFSIFCSVLMFSMTTRLLNKITHSIWFVFLMAFLWLALLQWIIWYLANTESKLDKRHEDLNNRELNVKAVVGTLAHITGFAFTFAFAELQQEFDGYAWCVVPAAIFSWVLIFAVCGAYRHQVIHADGKVTAEEELWEEECNESEHEAAGLCISFVLVQTIRQLCEGNLPNAEGNGGQRLMKTGGSPGQLLLMGMCFAVCICVVVVVQYRLTKAAHHGKEGDAHGHGGHSLSHRILDTIKETTTFATAWCFVFAIQAKLFKITGEDDESTILRTILAFVCSYLALGVTQFLDMLDDYSTKKQWSIRFEIRHSVFAVMGALGMLIGFTWERVFDEAVLDVSKAAGRVFSGGTLTTEWDSSIELYSRIFDVLINSALFTVSIIAFRWYVCPVCVRTRKIADQEKKRALGDDVFDTPIW